MKFLFLILLNALIVTFSTCSEGQKTSNNESTKSNAQTSISKTAKPQADPLAAGKKVYNTYCLTCHGQKGNMGASGAHDLTKTKLSLAEKVEVITEGRGLMTPHKFLGEEKINAVAKYIETFKE